MVADQIEENIQYNETMLEQYRAQKQELLRQLEKCEANIAHYRNCAAYWRFQLNAVEEPEKG